MSYRIFPILLLSISLPLFFLYSKNQNNTEASEKETALIEKLQELKKHLEELHISYEKSGISTKTTLNDKEQKLKDKHPKVKKLHESLTSVLADPTTAFKSKNKANAKEADGVSLKKKEDIGKKTFVDEIYDWSSSSINELKKLVKDNTPILIKDLKSEYSSSLKLENKINKYIYDEICKVLPDNLEPGTRANASAKIIGYLSSLTKADLEKLFKENKTVRQDLADDKSLKPNILPASSTLYDVLMLPGVEDDANAAHPVKDKAKAEARKTFEERFNNNKNLEIKSIQGADSEGDNNKKNIAAVSVEKLIANQSMVACAGFAKEIKFVVQQEIINQAKQSKGLLSLSTLKGYAVNIITESTDKKTIDTLFERFQNSKYTSPDYPTGFAMWLNNSSEMADYTTFSTGFLAWLDTIGNCIQVFENKLRTDNKLFSIVPKLFDKNIKVVLNVMLEGVNTAPTLMIYNKFLEAFKSQTGTNISIAQLDTIWQSAINSCKSDSFMLQIYTEEFINKSNSLTNVALAVAKMGTVFPKDSAIVGAVLDSKFIPAPLPVPKSKNDLNCMFLLTKEGRTQSIKLVFEIPLRFVVHKDKEGKELYVPIPAAEKMLRQQEASGYKITLDQVFVGKTTFTTVNRLEAVTPFTWKLTVEDTSSQTVIQEKKNAVFSFLNLNAGDALTEDALTTVFGEDSALGGKLLGLSINIVGDEYGNPDSILGEITILGMTFIVGTGKEGAIFKFKSPLAVIEEERQFTYGASGFDLYLTCDVHSDLKYGGNSYCDVTTQSGRIGGANGEFATELIKLTDYKGTPYGFPVIVENTGKN